MQHDMTQHDMMSHHITPHHTTPHHTTPHLTTLHHIASHHITSHHITSHHITSHHITSHHITSHHFTGDSAESIYTCDDALMCRCCYSVLWEGCCIRAAVLNSSPPSGSARGAVCPPQVPAHPLPDQPLQQVRRCMHRLSALS